MVTHDAPHNADPSEKVIDDHAAQSKEESGSTDRSTSGVATTGTTNSKGVKSSSSTSSPPMLENKDQQDIKFSLAVPHAALFPPTRTTPTSNKSSPLDYEPTNWKKRAAGARTTRKMKNAFSEEQATPTECLHSNVEEMSPDLGMNHEVGSVDNSIMDDDRTEQNRIEMDENPLSSPILAAELVENDEEAHDFVLGGNLWENKVQEEFQTRLLTLNQNIAVAEAVTKQTSSTKRQWMMWGLLLTLVVFAGAIVAGGVVTANNNKKADRSPQQVLESRGQKQVKLRKELTQRMNRTNSDDFKPFDDPSSPQSLALEWLLNDNITLTKSAVTQRVLDRYVLAVLYYSTDGPQWQQDVGSYFLLEQDVCDWNTGIPWSSVTEAFYQDAWMYLMVTQNETVGGVYCQGPQDEIRLSLNGCGLNGTLPWELSLLSNVVSFQVGLNSLVGTIPPELGQWSTLLDLVVSANMLTGTLPTELGLLTGLQYIWVGNNPLTGTLPTELGLLTAVQYLHVSNNMLTGTLPTELGLLTELQAFFVSYNHNLTGTLPTELGLLTALQNIWVNDNTLTGTLPTELGLLTELQEFLVKNNNLTGTLPTELGQLTALLALVLYNNALTGTLPTSLGFLTNVAYLDVEVNNLTGTLPTELGLLTGLQWFWVNDNRLTGTLPTELGQLTALLHLALFNNSLTGTLPTRLGYLTNVEDLYVDGNEFMGTIPTELGRLTAVVDLETYDMG